MKIVHLSTVDFSGKGISAYRLHKALQKKGVDSTLITLVKSSGDPSVKIITFDPFDKTKIFISDKVVPDTETISNYMIEEWSKLLKMQIMAPDGELFFSLPDSIINLEQIIEINQADIVHIHWSPGLVDINMAPIYFMNKPVFLTIYNKYPYTGGCHLHKCEKFKEECKNCPLLKEGVKEISTINFNIKKESYSNLNLYVNTTNNFLRKEAQESGIFGSDSKIEVIPPGISLKKFTRKNKKRAREHLHLPIDKFILIFCCSSLKDRKDDVLRLMEALKFLSKEGLDIYLILLGAHPEIVRRDMPFPVHALGFIPHEEVMCWYYSAADVFVNPSIRFEMSISTLEAMSCGLPVVAFDYGAMRDVVIHQKNGYLAKNYDMEDFAYGIKWILENEEKKIYLSKNARNKVKNDFNLEKVAENYIKLYEDKLKFPVKIKRQNLIKLGEKFFLNKDLNKSLLLFNKLLERNGEDAEVLNNIGVIYWQKGMFDKAKKFFKKAYELNPYLKEIRENYKKVTQHMDKK